MILNTQDGEVTDDTGYVEFRAMYMEDGQMQQIHEKSLFKRENQKWVYVSGVHFWKIQDRIGFQFRNLRIR